MPSEPLEQSRVVAFSDGVFAVAITLLVLDLHVPGGALRVPLRALLDTDLPNYVVFVLSFAIVGIKWLNHHRLFSRIRRVDTTLLLLNLLLLLGVTLVPFTTALFAAYLRTSEAAYASLLYGIVWTFNGIAYTLVLWYAQRRGFTASDGRSAAQRRMLRLYAAGPVGYAVGALLSFASVPLAIAIYCVVVCAYIFPPPEPRTGE